MVRGQLIGSRALGEASPKSKSAIAFPDLYSRKPRLHDCGHVIVCPGDVQRASTFKNQYYGLTGRDNYFQQLLLLPWQLKMARELASPVICASSPSIMTTTSALFAAAIASCMSAGAFGTCCRRSHRSAGSGRDAVIRCKLFPWTKYLRPSRTEYWRLEPLLLIPSSGVTASLALPLPPTGRVDRFGIRQRADHRYGLSISDPAAKDSFDFSKARWIPAPLARNL